MSEDDIWGVMDEQDEEFADVSDDVFAEVEPETVKPVEVTATAGTEIKETPVTAPVVPEPVITLAPTPTARARAHIVPTSTRPLATWGTQN